MLIDIHCHLTGTEYDSVEAVLARAKENGVERIVCSGFDLDSSYIAAELAALYEGVYFTAGFHPSELAKYRDGDFERLRALCTHEKCIAVGEIGLDYHFDDNPPREEQKKAFYAQMVIADELGLPIVVHSRDAAEDTYQLLCENKPLLKKGGLMHCYSYSAEMVDRFAELGFYFSFGGPCTFKNAKKVYASVERVPAHRILSETDCPYLTPVPFRGTFPNEPKNVKYVVERFAELRGEAQETLEQQIEQNAKALFEKLN